MRILFTIVLVCITVSFSAFGQVFTIDKFDALRADTLYTTSNGGGKCYINISTDSTDKVDGFASVKVRSRLDSLYPWGTFSQFGKALRSTDSPWDYSSSDSVSLWLKVRMAPKHPEYMSLRVELLDRPNPGDPIETYIYQIDGILDKVSSGWINLRIPIIERTSTGSEAPDSTGFIVAPSNWGGLTWNNRKLDRDKIVAWYIVLVTTPTTTAPSPATGNVPSDSIEVSFDSFTRSGLRAFPVTFFNGLALAPELGNGWTWGGSGLSIATGAGTTSKANAIKWVEGAGWTGIGYDVVPPFSMAGAWAKDSVQFKMKAEAGVNQVRIQFESANGKRGKLFQPTTDNLWHKYIFALRDFVTQDNAPNFDSTAMNKINFMSNGDAVAGKVVYITDFWSGNPVFDVIPPDAVTGLAAAGAVGGYSNILSWNPTNKSGAKYNVYYKSTPFTDVKDSTVEDLMPNNSPATTATHLLLAPNTDQNVTFYYGVVATDASGNQSPATITSTATTTKAKGVPTIALAPPANFAADGNLSEWTASTITPIVMSVVSGTAHGVPNYLVTDDNDLKVTAYLAVDASNLYVAFDVVDNAVIVDTTAANDYEQDCADLFIGTYDWRGKHHASYTGGATPDYHIRFSLNRIRFDQTNGSILMYASTAAAPNPNYVWKKKTLTPGYTIEAKIPFTMLAKVVTGRGDNVFVPKEGMRIPFDFAINDRDAATPSTRHAIMCYSPISNDNSWSAPTYWTNTWIGNKSTVGVAEQTSAEIPQSYELSQNYPNPFNPSTEIHYSLQKAGMVTLKIYDLMGREVGLLVNQFQNAGSYTVQFTSNQSAMNIASGVYFYRLQSGSFTAVKKMLLLK